MKLGSGGLVEDQIDAIFRLIGIRQDWRGGNSEQVCASSSGLGYQYRKWRGQVGLKSMRDKGTQLDRHCLVASCKFVIREQMQGR
ncbi:hypothetical protein L6452_44212 [Arctium lappa]|uniref:Uncharacterized protein n=1 Tax=Arctium lappa TaxID=4217 RepID=A0ACB8XF20_ARCLA|nr:hypothetical protein L6452_44212 [Arctium lappa]